MLRSCNENKMSVLEQVRNGQLDAIELSTSNLVDDIILTMHTNNILDYLNQGIKDKRNHNTTIPYQVIWASAIAAKMKVHSSLTDIPFAINDHRVLAELGYSLYDSDGNIGASLMNEGSLRFLIGKYKTEDFICGYNNTVQKHIMPGLNIESNIHILDCTDLEVNFDNRNYEGAGVAYGKRMIDGTKYLARGYKLATLRGLVDNSGLIEDIRIGSLNTHDLTLSCEMLLTSPVLKEGDILINDRGFLSRCLMNHLKTKRKVDTYIPLRKDMESYNIAVAVAKETNIWQNHPNKKFSRQRICLVTDLGNYWPSENEQEDVPINGCVVWDTAVDSYTVFVTTDTTKSAEMILKTYLIRPEIEEDYRQLKDFWRLEDFKSTKLNMICFHIVCVLFGYLFFQLYTMLPDGEKYANKSLPVLLKSYAAKTLSYVILYAGNEFCILNLFEMMEVYSKLSGKAKEKIKTVLE